MILHLLSQSLLTLPDIFLLILRHTTTASHKQQETN